MPNLFCKLLLWCVLLSFLATGAKAQGINNQPPKHYMKTVIGSREYFIKLNKHEYRITTFENTWKKGGRVWDAYRKTSWGAWKRVPMFTGAEERAFPKTVAAFAHTCLQAELA